MTGRLEPHRGTRLLLCVAALVIIVGGVAQARSVLASLLVALFLAVLGTRPVLWLQRRRAPPVVAALLVVSGMVASLLLAAALVGASFEGFAAAMPAYQERLGELVSSWRATLAARGIRGLEEALRGVANPAAVMSLTARLVTGLGAALSDAVLIVLTTAFILLEVSGFPGKLRAILGDPRQGFPEATRYVEDVKRYMVIKTLVSLATGVLAGGWLALLGVDFPILWGFLAFLLNYVPSIGSTLAAAPAVLLALIQLGPGHAALAAGGYAVLNVVLDNVIETRLMGRRLELSTLVVFLSLLVWGGLLGPVGMVLCVPLTMTLKFGCGQFEGTRWIAVALGPDVPEETRPEG
jgi:predicted PurR-regulated permease PerM